MLIGELLMSSKKPYAGIGSRKTPKNTLHFFDSLAVYFEYYGFALRSGGADGADSAFSKSVKSQNKEVYLPWKGFNKNPSPLYSISPQAFEIASEFHPSWKNLKPAVKKLHARNVHQILGEHLDSPCIFVVCWAPDGADGVDVPTSQKTGGTGQAIRIANSYNIPVFNVQRKEMISKLKDFFEGFLSST